MPVKKLKEIELPQARDKMQDAIDALESSVAILDGISRFLESIDNTLKTIRDVYIDQTGYHRPPQSG